MYTNTNTNANAYQNSAPYANGPFDHSRKDPSSLVQKMFCDLPSEGFLGSKSNQEDSKRSIFDRGVSHCDSSANIARDVASTAMLFMIPIGIPVGVMIGGISGALVGGLVAGPGGAFFGAVAGATTGAIAGSCIEDRICGRSAPPSAEYVAGAAVGAAAGAFLGNLMANSNRPPPASPFYNR